MAGASEAARPHVSTWRACEAGGLSGGALGLVRTLLDTGAIASLPAEHQANHIALTWLVWTVVGMFATGAFALCRPLLPSRARCAWPGLVALIVFLVVDVGMGALGLEEGAALAALVVASLACGAVLQRIVDRFAWLGSTLLWTLLGLGVAALAARAVSTSSAASHGISAAGRCVLVAPAVLLFVRAAFLPRARAGARLRPKLSVLLVVVVIAILGPVLVPDGARSIPRADDSLLLVTIDTLRADALGRYGAEDAHTPRLDRLADEGILFEDAESPVPMTYPAHTSLLSGVYPGNHGVLNNMPWPIPSGLDMLPDLFARRGYRTAAFVSGFTLKRNAARLHQRFQVYDDTFGPLRVVPDRFVDSGLVRLARRGAEVFGKKLRRLRYGGDRPAERTVASAVEWLESAEGPFFLWAHLFDPHLPYEPPSEFARLHDAGYRGGGDGSWYRVPPERKSELVRQPAEVEHLRALYRGEVSYADEQVGVLLDALTATGRDDDTVVVVTSDHGESLGEHDYWFDHSYFLYETCTRVPLVVRLPASFSEEGLTPPGTRITTPVRLVDLYPTLAELLGGSVSGEVDGRSLMPLLRGAPPEAVEPSLSVTYDLRVEARRYVLAARDGRFKLVRTAARWDDLWRLPEREQLFDLERDPGETRDVSREAPSDLERLRGLADRYWESWAPRDVSAAGALSAEDLERLGDIGY